MQTYRQSTFFFLCTVIFDIILCSIYIGFILLPLHIFAFMSSTLTLGEKSLVMKSGILSKKTHDIPYSKINSISIHKNIFGGIFNYGNIVISVGNDSSGLKFKYIYNPEQVKREIDTFIQKSSL